MTTMGPKLFMSSSPNPQVEPIRKQSSAAVSAQKKSQGLDLPIGPGHTKKRSRIFNSESEIMMDTGLDMKSHHAVPYVMV